MKALVLAGGSGSRLRPITHTSAKQLIPVANKPVLFYGLEAIAEAGVDEVGIVVGATGPEIRAAVGDGSRFGLRVTYIPQEEPLGLAHAVLIARDWLGDDDFVMYLGDNFIVGGISPIVEEFRAQRPEARILLTKVSDPTVFGVAELDPEGRVVALQEKPSHPRSDLAVVGIYLFTSAVHAAIRAITPSARGELEITDALQLLIDSGRDVRCTRITGYWKDTGNATDMLEVNRSVLNTVETRVEGTVDGDSELVGPVTIEPGARISRSRVVGPAAIGADAVIAGSFVGPYTSIAEDCRIENSKVEYSAVLYGTRIDGVDRVTAALIGCETTVTSASRVPAAHRFVLGDHSEIHIHG